MLEVPRWSDGGGPIGFPIGMQVLAPPHADELLFDVALTVERARPWPLVAPAHAAAREAAA